MQAQTKAQAQHAQRAKLASSYQELLNEFSNNELKYVGNYQLGRLIGKGSFGKVYLATHKLTNGSKVVLKSAKKDDHNLPREIHHHRQFIHPHIARLYEVIVTESLVWLALEWCPGDELYHHLLKHGRMEPAKVQKIFTQLIGAVSYVHQKSCVHRDLKLENILLDKHGNVKLVDFGFTREYEGKSSYLQTWCGTICYSAPEMIKGEKYAGEKVDVWSLGIILYALLAGELPFDDDNEEVTKHRITREEPDYPEHIPEQAKQLLNLLLSKRPLLRPSLADVLQHPWLAEHAPRQQEILKLQQPPPFSTELEKETLERMRSAGVDIDMVREHVLSQRCDSLAGWWALLIEKEERKVRRREKRRKEKESDAKVQRRLSGASSRLDRIAPTIREADEEHLTVPIVGEVPNGRGRTPKRSSSTAQAPDLPQLAEMSMINLELKEQPLRYDKPYPRSPSGSRPPPPPKERRQSQLSLLNNVANMTGATNGKAPQEQRRRMRFHHPILSQLASLKHWFKSQSKKRARSPTIAKSKSPIPQSIPQMRARTNVRRYSTTSTVSHRYSNTYSRPDVTPRQSSAQTPSFGPGGSGYHKRGSISPSPLTPHSSYRRSVSGLRGRKSTSSSLSSVRSTHHVHSHSKASSTSSATGSVASPTASSMRLRSPQNSVKVLPATPTSSQFPPGIRVARVPDGLRHPSSEGSAAFSSLPPPSPGLPVFAKRKRSVFKGPMLSLTQNNSRSRIGGVDGGGGGGSQRNSVAGARRSNDLIEEEDEDEEVEEVEDFSPVKLGEQLEEILDMRDSPASSPVRELAAPSFKRLPSAG